MYDVLKTPLITALGAYNSRMARWNFLLFSNFDKHDTTQLLAKFKKIMYIGFRATFIFWKFKVALNPTYRMFLKLRRLMWKLLELHWRLKDTTWNGIGSITSHCLIPRALVDPTRVIERSAENKSERFFYYFGWSTDKRIEENSNDAFCFYLYSIVNRYFKDEYGHGEKIWSK